MPGATTRFQLPYPLGSEPVADGDDAIKALAEKLDTVLYTGNAWLSLVLATNWVNQATYPWPAYRIIDGMCQLRGTVRRSDNAIPGTSNMFNCPVPGGGGTAGTSVVINAMAFRTSGGPYVRVAINPRSDGIARCFNDNQAAIADLNLVDLNGLSYPVT